MGKSVRIAWSPSVSAQAGGERAVPLGRGGRDASVIIRETLLTVGESLGTRFPEGTPTDVCCGARISK